MNTELCSLLLQHMGGGSGMPGNPGSSVHDLLAQLGETDPRAALVARYLAQREVAPSDTVPTHALIGDEKVQDVGEALRARSGVASDHLQRMAQAMYGELEQLRERNDLLASALGACYLCWGADPGCPICRGGGSPGFERPDALLFHQLVGPAQSRLRADEARSHERPRPHSGTHERRE